MKKIILLLISAISLTCIFSPASANPDKIPFVSATASSVYYSNVSSYGPQRTIDGNLSTYWRGEINQTYWWLMYDAGKVTYVGELIIYWYPSTYYIPLAYNIQISNDAVNWVNVYTAIKGVNSSLGESRIIKRDTRYIRLYITKITSGYQPILREFEAYVTVKGVPQLMRFQGDITDTLGLPLNGTYKMTFRIYTRAEGGTPWWTEVQNIYIEEGLLDVELGSVSPINLSFDRQYWLTVQVETDAEMSPRFKLTTMPYSFMSRKVQ